MKLRFYGADRCVTGSCHCLEVNGKHILVDCGLQQGRDEIDNTALHNRKAARLTDNCSQKIFLH